MRFLLFSLAFLASQANADGLKFGEDWSTADTVRQAVVTGLLIADWGQTRYIVKHPRDATNPNGTYEWRAETNPTLGKHPSVGSVDVYFAAAIAGHALVSAFLPTEWRQGWQYVWIGIETNQVVRNYRAGIKMDF